MAGEETPAAGPVLLRRREVRIFWPALFFAVWALLFVFLPFYVSSGNLEIIAAVQKVPAGAADQSGATKNGGTERPEGQQADRKADTSSQWRVTGRVLAGGAPMEGALVWCVGYDSAGNAYTPPAQRTNANGEFTIEAIPEKLASDNAIKEIRITAKDTSWWGKFRNEAVSVLSLFSGSEAVKLSQVNTSWTLLVPPVCFICTLMLVGLASWDGSAARRAYYGGLVLSLLLTGFMVWTIAVGINTFNTSVPHGQVRTLGFLTIFEGTYVENSGPEWLVSLTSPPAVSKDATAAVVRSLGAPFWVIFLAVLGAGLLTMILVIQGISGPPNFDPLDRRFGERMRAILEHQFFVLFAPLSGIFIFQLLVIAGAAKEPVTVGTIILGAGATLNGLLARAVKAAEQYLQAAQTSEPGTAAHN